jgi:molecular chaperone DnaK
MAGKEYTPAQVSAKILETLKQAAERETGLEVKKVVVTVPAYFTDFQRKETIQAGELAGLEVVRIINEPTAAALAYGCRQGQRERILVYDLGGGTFDISLIDVEEGITEVLASDGNTRLGGDDFDLALDELFRSYLPEAIRQQNDLKLDARLKKLSEAVKIKLSTESRTAVKEEFIATVEGKPVHLELSVSREEFEERIAARLDVTVTLLESVLKQGKVEKEKISRVLLISRRFSIDSAPTWALKCTGKWTPPIVWHWVRPYRAPLFQGKKWKPYWWMLIPIPWASAAWTAVSWEI